MLRLMVMRLMAAAAVLLAVAVCSSPSHWSSRPAGPAAGPSARQLARGRWLPMPAAPIRLCDPLAAWDGRDLVVVEPGFPPCPAAAAAYDPAANRWALIASPPRLWAGSGLFGGEPAAAWEGGRLVLVSPATGVTLTWRPGADRWDRAGTLPSPGVVSVTRAGRRFVAITVRRLGVNAGTAKAFALGGGRWTPLPVLPRPRTGWIADAAAAFYRGSVYVLAGISVAHTNPNDMYESGRAELLRLTGSAWTPVPLPLGAPISQLALTSVGGAMMATGSACPASAGCTQEDGAAALLRPGARPAVIPLRPGPGVPYPRDIAAGPQAVVVVYSEGLGRVTAGNRARAGSQRDLRHRHRAMAERPSRPRDASQSWRVLGHVLDPRRHRIPAPSQQGRRHRRLAPAARPPELTPALAGSGTARTTALPARAGLRLPHLAPPIRPAATSRDAIPNTRICAHVRPAPKGPAAGAYRRSHALSA